MAKKMYYTEQEAAAKLGVSIDEMNSAFVREGKLRSYLDGTRKMYKVDDVDALATSSGAAEIELSPVDTAAGDAVSLVDTNKPGKEDTVITASGISVFDEEELEIESADPLAKTQIAPTLEDQAAPEGAGSGSGLLDLTRESDDTSLGPVLDHIDMEGAVGSDIAAETGAPQSAFAPPPDAAVMEPAMTLVEKSDPTDGAFSGLIIAASAIVLLLAFVAAAIMSGTLPALVQVLNENILVVVIAALVFFGVCAGAGFFVTKSLTAGRKAE